MEAVLFAFIIKDVAHAICVVKVLQNVNMGSEKKIVNIVEKNVNMVGECLRGVDHVNVKFVFITHTILDVKFVTLISTIV